MRLFKGFEMSCFIMPSANYEGEVKDGSIWIVNYLVYRSLEVYKRTYNSYFQVIVDARVGRNCAIYLVGKIQKC